jgi:hypothetical protein
MMKDKNRVFSIELDSKKDLKNITLENRGNNKVTIEGTIGKLVAARFEEEVILEIVGSDGVIRIDLCNDEIREEEE